MIHSIFVNVIKLQSSVVKIRDKMVIYVLTGTHSVNKHYAPPIIVVVF